jgi:exosome complex component RRP4
MSNLLIEAKQICVPGDLLAKGMDFLPAVGTSREGENIVANKLGIVNVNGRLISVIPVSGKYTPKRGDTIIGKVFDVTMSGWRVNINCAYSAMLMVRDATNEYIPKNQDLTKLYNFDDLLVAKIENVTSQNLIDLSMRGPGLRKLMGGLTINVTPSKVPRIIGKQGSMVSMIKRATGARIIVGQNGVVWISCEDPKMELIALNTVKKIEENAHISGLTDKIKEYLDNIVGPIDYSQPESSNESQDAQESNSGDNNEQL